jgi:hypothetical protein
VSLPKNGLPVVPMTLYSNNGELYEAMYQLERMILVGQAQGFEPESIVKSLLTHIRETLLCNDALWHLYGIEEKKLFRKQAREQRRERLNKTKE